MAGFNLMNRYLYGKAGQADYTPENLPASRPALFFDMLRIHLGGIVGLNLLYALFCLPALLWTGFNLLTVMTLLGDGTAVNIVNDGYLTVYLLGMIPCLALSGVGATGEMYVLRNWARDQHTFMFSDFKDAVKGNWKCGLLTGLIDGLTLLITAVCYLFYGQMAQQSVFWLFPQMIVVLICVVWWMMNMLIFPMMVTYEMRYRDVLRNCAIMAVARLPWTVLFFVGSVALPAALLVLIPEPYNYLIAMGFYLLLGFGLTGLVYASYANSCFDKYLNPKIEGAAVNMGLRKEEDAFDPDEVDDPNPVDR